MKRAFDLFCAGTGLVALLPLMVIIIIAVRLETPGPSLFRQVRVGRHGEPFEIIKFRSMRVSGAGPSVTASDDSRITRTGRVLRSTKLDEIPQLWNVVRGDMSLVGPRPEVPRYVRLWPEEQRTTILSVRPGLTDPASVHFRREEELLAAQTDPESFYVEEVLPRKAEMYVEYARTRTFIGDLRILVGTARSVVTG